jgi:hypothetical protein
MSLSNGSLKLVIMMLVWIAISVAPLYLRFGNTHEFGFWFVLVLTVIIFPVMFIFIPLWVDSNKNKSQLNELSDRFKKLEKEKDSHYPGKG